MLSIIYFYLKICMFLSENTTENLTLGEGRSKYYALFLWVSVKRITFSYWLLLFYTSRCDVVIRNSMRAANDVQVMKKQEF